MTMPETTVGLPDNNLFGNLIANTRPSASNPGSQTLNINSIQSDTKAGEVEDIENADNIPFQEILGLHICNLNIHDTPNSPVPNTPAVESADIELAQESVTETNPSVFCEQKSDTIQPADLLQKIFPDAHNGHPPISPFVPLSQRESNWGFRERTGVNMLPDKQLIETYNPSSIFSMKKSHVNTVDEMDKLFIPDMNVRNALPKTDTLKLNPLNKTEIPQISGASSLNNIKQSDLYSSDINEINIKELPETYKQLAQNISPENKNGIPIPAINNSSNAKEQLTENVLSKINGTVSSKQDISSISQTNENWNSFDSHTQKQNTSDTVSFDAHTPKTNNGSHFSLDSQTTVNNAQSNATDFQQNTKASPNSGAPLSSSIEDAKTINHIYHSNNILHFPSSDIYEINVKELPETYKQLAQKVSPENKNGVPIPVINNSSNAKEQLTENGLSKINGTVSLKQDISSISQTNEEWNSFDSHTQKQNTSDIVSFDAHIPKTNNGSPFSSDSQTTASNAQSNVPDFQQNTKASPHSGTPLSSSAADAKTVNHMFYSNDVPGVEHAQ